MCCFNVYALRETMTANKLLMHLFGRVCSSWLLGWFFVCVCVVRTLKGSSLFSSVWSHSVTPWTAARQASLSITNSRSSPTVISIESVMPTNHLILYHPLLTCLQSFSASGSFPLSWLSAAGGQSTEDSASASVLPMTIEG